MTAAEQLSPEASLTAAWHALGVSRATLYRRRKAAETPRQRRLASPSPRALTSEERAEVRRTLCDERFMDRSPRAVHLCSVRTMYRILEDATGVRERRNQLHHPAYAAPQLLATRPNEV